MDTKRTQDRVGNRDSCRLRQMLTGEEWYNEIFIDI